MSSFLCKGKNKSEKRWVEDWKGREVTGTIEKGRESGDYRWWPKCRVPPHLLTLSTNLRQCVFVSSVGNASHRNFRFFRHVRGLNRDVSDRTTDVKGVFLLRKDVFRAHLYVWTLDFTVTEETLVTTRLWTLVGTNQFPKDTTHDTRCPDFWGQVHKRQGEVGRRVGDLPEIVCVSVSPLYWDSGRGSPET